MLNNLQKVQLVAGQNHSPLRSVFFHPLSAVCRYLILVLRNPVSTLRSAMIPMSCSFLRSFLNLIASAQRTRFYIQRNSRLSDIIVYPGYQTFFSRAAGIFGVVRAGHYKDLTETGNRA